MDENKLKKLHEIGYKFQPCCGMCKHSTFSPGSMFGDCGIHSYDHLKHTAESKPLSVNVFGHCPRYEFEERLLSKLHGFAEFLPK